LLALKTLGHGIHSECLELFRLYPCSHRNLASSIWSMIVSVNSNDLITLITKTSSNLIITASLFLDGYLFLSCQEEIPLSYFLPLLVGLDQRPGILFRPNKTRFALTTCCGGEVFAVGVWSSPPLLEKLLPSRPDLFVCAE
jgi:hypothetical protein